MNKPVLSRKDISEYIFLKLKETHWKFPKAITPFTTFRELHRHDDPDLIAPDLLMDLEVDLGVYLPDEAVKALDRQEVTVDALINTVVRHLPKETNSGKNSTRVGD